MSLLHILASRMPHGLLGRMPENLCFQESTASPGMVPKCRFPFGSSGVAQGLGNQLVARLQEVFAGLLPNEAIHRKNLISSSGAYSKSLWIYHLILVHLVKVQREFAVMTTGDTVLQSLGLTMATFNVSLIT